MTKGILIFAFNSEQLDYLAMAAWAANNIHRHLNLPVAVVTDITDIPEHYNFDRVVHTVAHEPTSRGFRDIDGSVKWYNGNRVDAYALSPWDQTLVLDADYIVASDQLLTLFDIDQDFICHRMAYDITGAQPFTDVNWFGGHSMPMWWATVMMFRRSPTAKMIFSCMQMIKANWQHYRDIYKISESTYRNDYALSIALGIVNGHTLNHAGIPWDLATLTSAHVVELVDQDCYKIIFQDATEKYQWIQLNNQDFHAMGKRHLGELIANSK
jgi:hypothetical protein